MMWKKSWWECRSRVLLTALIAVLYGPLGFFLLTRPGKQPVGWEAYCELVAIAMPAVALMLAGSGVNPQTSWGMAQGFHPSMYFLLSLPVSRRRALLIRSALGAALLAGFLALMVAGVGAAAVLGGAKIPESHLLASSISMTIGAFGFFGVETFLTTWLDELWAGMLGFALAGGMFGASWVFRTWGVMLRPLQFVTGTLWNRYGQVGWLDLALFLGLAAAGIGAAILVVERKEY